MGYRDGSYFEDDEVPDHFGVPQFLSKMPRRSRVKYYSTTEELEKDFDNDVAAYGRALRAFKKGTPMPPKKEKKNFPDIPLVINLKAATRISRVQFGRTINMGNYESVRIDIEADVPEGRDHKEVLNDLREEMRTIESKTKAKLNY